MVCLYVLLAYFVGDHLVGEKGAGCLDSICSAVCVLSVMFFFPRPLCVIGR